MEVKKLKELIDLFETTSLTQMSIKDDQGEITLIKENTVQNVVIPVPQALQPDLDWSPEKTIKSPIVGIFYAASSPSADPYKKVGDQIEVGDVLCVIESMKTMNEIISDQQGVLEKIHLANGDLVEFDQVLFTLK